MHRGLVSLVAIFSLSFFQLQADTVYVGSGTNGVTALDTASNSVIATIDTLGSASNIALTPNHRFLYIAAGPSVYVVDTSTNSVIATIDGFSQASSIIANDEFAYVGDQGTAVLSAIDISSNTLVAAFPGAAGYSKMGMTPDGQLLYSSAASLNQVIVIDTQNNTIVATIDTPSSDKINNFTAYQRAYLVILNRNVYVIDTTTNTVLATPNVSEARWAAVTPQGLLYVVGLSTANVIDSENNVIAMIPLGIDSAQFAISRPDGKFVYAAGSTGISVIDTSSQAAVSVIDTGTEVDWIVCTPDSQFLYASLGFNNTILVIDAQKNNIVATLPVQDRPSQLAYLSSGIDSSSFSSSVSFDPSGRQIKQRFFTHTDLVNIISWTAPTGFTPIAYNLYRDSLQTDLAGSVSGHQLEFHDHNRVKKQFYTYYLVAVDVDGNTLNMGTIRVMPIM